MGVSELILTRSGLVFLPQPHPNLPAAPENLLQAAELELANLGYVMSHRLRRQMARFDIMQLNEQQRWLCNTLAAHLGAGRSHVPLFRKFPDGVPSDTFELYIKKILTFYLMPTQEEPCLFCGQTETTHLLNPCRHVVCDHCFDGSNYSRCPICEQTVDQNSPFFKPDEVWRGLSPTEHVRFKRLDLCENIEIASQKLYESLCLRPQAMSPDDVLALTTLVQGYGLGVLPWTPALIPVRENRAHIFGNLLKTLPPDTVLTAARPHLSTATDLLRLIAAYSGVSPALQKTARISWSKPDNFKRWSQNTQDKLHVLWKHYQRYPSVQGAPQNINSARFKIAKMGRPLRRALLALLESFPADSVMEDMLRRPNDWIWLGEFLHPFEYATRFPNTARAFSVIRGSKGPLAQQLGASVAQQNNYCVDQKGKLRFIGFNSKTERLIAAREGSALSAHLSARPGELARRLDLALRLGDAASQQRTTAHFLARLSLISTPVLLGLASSLPRRQSRWPIRIYFPKGAEFKAPSSWDKRPLLPPESTQALVGAIERELLRRFAEKPHFAEACLDIRLSPLIVPFNERTASPAAVNLTRGSWIPVPRSKTARLFMHWCQPPKGETTDLDLSVALYDEKWDYLDCCSFYQLETSRLGKVIARSSGDLRDAPFPDGASEFIDLDREAALSTGVRYAVMVVTAYSGMSFSALERSFAGLMTRDDVTGAIFDPRTVQLRFNLSGENGVYMPMLFDVQNSKIFWLDGYSTGDFAMNSVATANNAIQRICKETISYFGHGVRASMHTLTALHAAARCDRVQVRDGQGSFVYQRRLQEGNVDFYRRIISGDADHLLSEFQPPQAPALVASFIGDFAVPEGSLCYALFREQWTETVAASDLL